MKNSPIKISETIRPGDVIALGDIHATWDLYSQFLAWIKDSQATVVLLGDMVDRGKDDLIVLDITEKLLNDPEFWGLNAFYALRGNHEQMFLDAASGWKSSMSLWLRNGGNAKDFSKMAEKHRDWIAELPVYMTIGDTLFVHGGLFPGEDPAKSIANGKTEELVWMRGAFLKLGPELSKWSDKLNKVVHGHTITMYETDRDEAVPVVRKDRVNIDTGAFLKNGCLTAYNVTQNTFNQFHHPKPTR